MQRRSLFHKLTYVNNPFVLVLDIPADTRLFAGIFVSLWNGYGAKLPEKIFPYVGHNPAKSICHVIGKSEEMEGLHRKGSFHTAIRFNNVGSWFDFPISDVAPITSAAEKRCNASSSPALALAPSHMTENLDASAGYLKRIAVWEMTCCVCSTQFVTGKHVTYDFGGQKMDMKWYGFDEMSKQQKQWGTSYETKTVARVVATHKGRYDIVSAKGMGTACLKKKEYYGEDATEQFPTTGDFVLVDWQASGDSRIVKTLPRKTFFSRLDPTPGFPAEQAVAANFDYVLIVQSLNRDWNERRLERYLTLAWQSGAQPIVVLTKADLAEDVPSMVQKTREITKEVPVFAVSSYTGEGVLELMEACVGIGKTLVLLGSSGVGKSSLVNALAGHEVMLTQAIREDDARGRHTTTHRQLISLPAGVCVIDTPGMRELGMWDVSEGLDQAFPDVEQYLGMCKFRDCRHESEPGCALRGAIAAGALSEERFQSYLRLKKEARFTADTDAQMRQKRERMHIIARQRRQRKKR